MFKIARQILEAHPLNQDFLNEVLVWNATVLNLAFLMKHGANIDAVSSAALHDTVLSSHLNEEDGLRFYEFILTRAPHLVSSVNLLHQTPLLCIKWQQKPDGSSESAIKNVRMLVKAGADINAQDAEGCTALHYYANSSLLAGRFVHELVDLGADPNRRDREGMTPLHAAITNSAFGEKKEEVALALLARGANPKLRCNEGLTPLDLAHAYHLQWAIDILSSSEGT